MVYRTVDPDLVGARRDALLGARRLEATALLASEVPVVTVYRRRWTRCAFGVAGIVMAALLVDAAVTGGRVPLTPILEGSWFVLGLVLIVARPAALAALRRELERRFAPSADAAGDILAFEALTAERAIADAADRLEQRSVALPLSACALLLPLTLHRLAGVTAGALLYVPNVVWFAGPTPMDRWIRASMFLVGHCHILLALLSCAFARDLRRHPDLPEEAMAQRAGWAAFAWTSLASIPASTLCLALWPLDGWFVFMLVPLVVTLTGLTFIPAAFQTIGRAIARERAEIR